MRVYELKARHDARASFYGKATVTVHDDGRRVLTSYATDVAEVTADGDMIVHGEYSATTRRHIREFVAQHTGEYLPFPEVRARYMAAA